MSSSKQKSTSEPIAKQRADGVAASPQSSNGGSSQVERRRARESELFDALRVDDDDTIPVSAFTDACTRMGLRLDDPRLTESMAKLRSSTQNLATKRISLKQFSEIIKPNVVVIERALQGSMIIPDFDEFCGSVREIYEHTKDNESGAVADYIPQLARVDPEQYGISLCTIDGQRHSIGDARTDFCVQSCCKPINYCIALEDQGEDKVHHHIGREPSGHSFNELTLNSAGRPHNPMINAGAVMACSLIRPDLTNADRFDYVMDTWTQLSGGSKPRFSNSTYLSERRTADRNFALGYFMREKRAFPENSDLIETLEFYFQCCSLEATAESMSVVAATLANGGICPTTGERVFKPNTVQKCLSLMYSCGMYDFSGEWAFSIGLPGKSGVAGAVLVVVPNVMGLCAWSPRLDEIGNSVRAVDFFRQLVNNHKFHKYDNLAGGLHDKKDPRLPSSQHKTATITDLCWAANEGDLTAIRRLVARGVNLDDGDYDGRTALHLAVCEGHRHVVEYFVSRKVNLSPRDRWGGTPLDDAHREKHEEIAKLLEQHGAARGG
jgi:glutaminase